MLNRLILLGLCLIVAALFVRLDDQAGGRRPAPERFDPPPVAAQDQDRDPQGGRLPAESRRDPVLQLNDSDPCAEACTGTAFAIDDRGHWLTARHVVEGCGRIGLMTGPRRWVPVEEVTSHPRADVSLLTAELTAAPLPLSDGRLFEGQDGFHLGYPRGEPGDVYGELLGRVKVRSRRFTEPGVMWAEVDRRPWNDLPLGGLSGGPVLSSEGAVIGVAIAASPRRGRVTSAAPRSLNEVLKDAGVAVAPQSPAEVPGDIKVAPSNYAAYGDHLRSQLTVAKVLCWGGSGDNRRRPPIR